MACTYNYDTGKLTMDFHLIKDGEICYLRGKGYASLLTNDFLEEGVGAISDFCHINHLDYHGLIENGFALKAPLGMYKLKE